MSESAFLIALLVFLATYLTLITIVIIRIERYLKDLRGKMLLVSDVPDDYRTLQDSLQTDNADHLHLPDGAMLGIQGEPEFMERYRGQL